MRTRAWRLWWIFALASVGCGQLETIGEALAAEDESTQAGPPETKLVAVPVPQVLPPVHEFEPAFDPEAPPPVEPSEPVAVPRPKAAPVVKKKPKPAKSRKTPDHAASVRKVISANIKQVRACRLELDPFAERRALSIQFTIGPDGRVPVAVVKKADAGARELANCVAKAVKRMRFDPPPPGGRVVFSHGFAL